MISSEIARCIARLSGDGNLYKEYIRYSNNSMELLNHFVSDIRLIFGGVTITYGIGNSNTPFVHIRNKHVVNFFLKYLPSYKSSDIFVPEEVMNASYCIQKEYLRAFYDDEGCVNFRVFNKSME